MHLRNAIVADDVPEILDSVTKILERAGYTVRTAQSGREAVEFLRANPCDLLVTDMLMPEMDGIELILEVKRTKHATRILAISGGGRTVTSDYCVNLAKALGAHATLMKPFNRVQFLAAVDNAFAN